jgi:hypothetical protein
MRILAYILLFLSPIACNGQFGGLSGGVVLPAVASATGPTYDASNTNSNIVLSAGNTVATMTTTGSSAQGLSYLLSPMVSSMVELEMVVTYTGGLGSNYFFGVGFCSGSRAASVGTWSPGNVSAGYAYACDAGAGQKVHNGTETAWGVAVSSNDTMMMAVDNSNGFVYFGKNGTWMNSGVPTSGASGTGSAYSFTPGSTIYMAASLGNYSGGRKCVITLLASGHHVPAGYTYGQ